MYDKQLLMCTVCLQVAVGMLFFGALIGWFMPCGLGGRYWYVSADSPFN